MKKNDETGELCTSGIGGDDKVGVYTCLNALFQEGIESVKVSFFRNEEIGCIGSKAADMKWFEDVNWVCQLDRRG